MKHAKNIELSKFDKYFNRNKYNIYKIIFNSIYTEILSNDDIKTLFLKKLKLDFVDDKVITSFNGKLFCEISATTSDDIVYINTKEIYDSIKSGYIKNTNQITYMILRNIDPIYFEANALSLIEKSNSMLGIKTILKYYKCGKFNHVFNIDRSRQQILENIKEWSDFYDGC